MIDANGRSQPLDTSSIVATLAHFRVRYLIVGGFAVAAHGYPRATGDLDIVPDPDPENVTALHRALTDLRATVLGAGDFEAHELPLDLTVDNLKLGGNWRLATRFGVLDILQHIEPVIRSPEDFAQLASRAATAEIAARQVLIIGYDDLIALKLLAGRDQDLIDVRALREANEDTAP